MTVIQQKVRNSGHFDGTSVLEQVLMLVASHVGHHPCCCLKVDPRWSFSSQLLSIPFLWHRLPQLKKVNISFNIFVCLFFGLSPMTSKLEIAIHFSQYRLTYITLHLLLWSLKSYYNINLYNQYLWKKFFFEELSSFTNYLNDNICDVLPLYTSGFLR